MSAKKPAKTSPSIPILFETNEIFVVFKRAGLATQGGAGLSHSLDELLGEQVGQKVFLVHRLDLETSGVMVVAKSAQAADKWTKLIASKAVKKTYKALCVRSENTPVAKSATITTPLIEKGRAVTATTRYKVLAEKKVILKKSEAVLGNGEGKSFLDKREKRFAGAMEALGKKKSEVVSEEGNRNENFNNGARSFEGARGAFNKSGRKRAREDAFFGQSGGEVGGKGLFGESAFGEAVVIMEVLVTIETGRTHQIRRHLASIGCPIIADDKYGNFRLNRALKKHCGVKRLQLCCTSLECSAGLAPFKVQLSHEEAGSGCPSQSANQKEACIPLFPMARF